MIEMRISYILGSRARYRCVMCTQAYSLIALYSIWAFSKMIKSECGMCVCRWWCCCCCYLVLSFLAFIFVYPFISGRESEKLSMCSFTFFAADAAIRAAWMYEPTEHCSDCAYSNETVHVIMKQRSECLRANMFIFPFPVKKQWSAQNSDQTFCEIKATDSALGSLLVYLAKSCLFYFYFYIINLRRFALGVSSDSSKISKCISLYPFLFFIKRSEWFAHYALLYAFHYGYGTNSSLMTIVNVKLKLLL